MSVLEVTNLTLRFGGLLAVNGFDLSVPDRSIFSIIGPNGAGKTTVFNAITGVYEPTQGRIALQGRDLRRPFTARVLAGSALVGLVSGLLLAGAIHAEAMWREAIEGNYRFRQAFPWGEAARDLGAFIAAHPTGVGIAFLVGAGLGFGGALVVWQRQRRTPHGVAAQGVCRTFQNIRLFQDMTVLENVLMGMDRRLTTRVWHMALRLPRFYREERKASGEARGLLDFVGLGRREGVLAKNLAYGEQRRLEIARALATEPRLLLLDEPAAGMNTAETVDLMRLIQRIRERGITVLLIEHRMDVVMGISDRIAVLDYGIKIAEGTPDEVKADPRVIEAYLGKEETA